MPLYWRIRLKHPDKVDSPHGAERRRLCDGELTTQKASRFAVCTIWRRTDDPVIVCEGVVRRCAGDRWGDGTTSGAADSAGKTDWRPPAGRTVTIWPDNDEAGERYGRDRFCRHCRAAIILGQALALAKAIREGK